MKKKITGDRRVALESTSKIHCCFTEGYSPLLSVCIRNDFEMNGMSTKLEDELASIIQLQKKIKGQQV